MIQSQDPYQGIFFHKSLQVLLETHLVSYQGIGIDEVIDADTGISFQLKINIGQLRT